MCWLCRMPDLHVPGSWEREGGSWEQCPLHFCHLARCAAVAAASPLHAPTTLFGKYATTQRRHQLPVVLAGHIGSFGNTGCLHNTGCFHNPLTGA